MNKILLAMIALLFAISAVPVAFAEDEAADVTAADMTAPADEASPDALPPLIDPATEEKS
jgi:hypothetical protein